MLQEPSLSFANYVCLTKFLYKTQTTETKRYYFTMSKDNKKEIDLSPRIDVTSRLEKGQARKVLSEILKSDPSFVSYSKHGQGQMKARGLIAGDVFNVLMAGKIEGDPEFVNESWRYRVATKNITVVVAFRKPNHVTVITAWRN